MERVATALPADDDIQTLYAEALMNINAWKLWTIEGKPAPGTEKIVAILQAVLKRNPSHPGANHYYIHAMEASPHPELAIVEADRLVGMMPAAGHLEHMPAHIMQRVGRYEDAAIANRKGVVADLAYYAKTHPPDYYGMYLAHNYQFLAYSSSMEGRRQETLDATHKARAAMTDEMLLAMPGLDWYSAETYAAMIRFGMWDEILAQTPPNKKLLGLRGAYFYARSTALAAKDRHDDAETALSELEALIAEMPNDYGAGLNRGKDVLRLAELDAKARIAASEGSHITAVRLLQQAVAEEEALAYDEPSDWFLPERHLLGAELMHISRFKDAEEVYRRDLIRNPHNGWALYGLEQSLVAQKKLSEANGVKAQFDAAWKYADVSLTASTIY